MPNPKAIWESFFEACDLPKKLRQEYAESFVSQRIQPNMLKELDKDMLKELGVIALGDQLAIMRYVKETGGVNAPAFKQIQTSSSKEQVTTSSSQQGPNGRYVQKAKATSTSRVPMVSRSIAIRKPQSAQPRVTGLRSDEILQERAGTYRQQEQPNSYSRIDRTLVVSNRRPSFTQNDMRRTQILPRALSRELPREPVRRANYGQSIRERVTRRPPTFDRSQYY